MITTTLPPQPRPEARLYASVQMPAKRLFQTDEPTPCRDNPKLFFDPRRKRRATAQCTPCPFVGRCGYNAGTTGATHIETAPEPPQVGADAASTVAS
jgi:WhiB family transcriptional regulator, redox-sensing transcriptional regulator